MAPLRKAQLPNMGAKCWKETNNLSLLDFKPKNGFSIKLTANYCYI